MITNAENQETKFLSFVLKEGEESNPISLYVTVEDLQAAIFTGSNPGGLELLGKIAGEPLYQDLVILPLDLTPYLNITTEVLVKVIAPNPAPGYNIYKTSVGLFSSKSAAWLE